MFAWIKNKFAKKQPEVVPQRQSFRATASAPYPSQPPQPPVTDRVFIFPDQSPVAVFRDIAEKQGHSVDEARFEVAEKYVAQPIRYEPAPTPEPRADFTYTEPSNSYSSCDYSNSSDSSSSSCSSD